jgi:hypothetical protein
MDSQLLISDWQKNLFLLMKQVSSLMISETSTQCPIPYVNFVDSFNNTTATYDIFLLNQKVGSLFPLTNVIQKNCLPFFGPLR